MLRLCGPVMNGSPSGQLWLFRPKPLADELLSSWLVRSAIANVQKVHTFCTFNWGPRHHIWERDVDKLAEERILNVMSQKTNTPYERVRRTTLRDLQGTLFEADSHRGNISWVLPIGRNGRFHRGFGLQFCPICLQSDKEPYYRRRWRISFFVACPEHGCYLHDACQTCSAPVTFHDTDYGKHMVRLPATMASCPKCGEDRRKAAVGFCTGDRGQRISRCVTKFSAALDEEWGEVPGETGQYIMGIPYFNGLRLLVRTLSSRAAKGEIRALIAERANIDVPQTSVSESFDYMRLNDRIFILEILDRLLERWPDSFVQIFKACKLSRSQLYVTKQETPFWFWLVASEKMDKSRYHPSPEEIESCRKYLIAQGGNPGRNTINRWIGCSYVDKRRYKR